MYERIKRITRTATFKQTVVVGGATVANGVLGLIFYILIARFLGATSFGIFAVVVAAISLLMDIANVGTDTGTINFVGRFIGREKDKALSFLKIGLIVKIVAGAITLILGWFLVPYVSTVFLHKPELTDPLRLGLLGVATGLLFTFGTSAIQAIQKFVVWGVVNVFFNGARLFFTILLFTLGVLTLTNSIWIYILIPFAGFFAALLFLPNFFKAKVKEKYVSQIFHYNKWVAIFTLVAAIASRLDTFLVTRFLPLNTVGVYSVASNLSSVVPQIVAAIGTVVAPKLAGFNDHRSAVLFLKKMQLFVLGLAVLGIVGGLPVGYFIIHRFYSGEYLASFTPYSILLVAQVIFLISIPVHTAVVYYFSYPKLFVLIGIVNLLIVIVGGSILIPTIGMVGAASIVLIGNISNFVIPAIWVLKKFKS